MDIHVEKSGSYCVPKSISYKGKELFLYDFGSMEDADHENRPEYGCGDRVFVRIPATPDVLAEYDITAEEYEAICDYLEKELHWGRCSYCA